MPVRAHPKPEVSPPRSKGGGAVLAWRFPRTGYGRAIDGVLAGLRPRIRAAEREWAAAPWLLSELLRHTPARRELLVRNSRRFRNLALCGLLLESSRQDGSAAPRGGERLAALALALVESLDADWYGDWALADARARCWMSIGNARRIAADLRGAEEALRKAEAHLRRGTGDRLDRDQLLAYKAALRRARQ
jgi:hypothetical protein